MLELTYLLNVRPEEFHLSGNCAGDATKVNFPLFLRSLFAFFLLLMVSGTRADKLWWGTDETVSPVDPLSVLSCTFSFPSEVSHLSYLLGCSLLPPSFLGEVSRHPLHLLQKVVPVGLWTGGFHEFWEPAGRPLAFLPQLRDALMHLTLLRDGNRV